MCLLTLTQIPQPMQSSSEMYDSLDVGLTSTHCLPAHREPTELQRCFQLMLLCQANQESQQLQRTNFHHGAALLAFLPALLWLAPVSIKSPRRVSEIQWVHWKAHTAQAIREPQAANPTRSHLASLTIAIRVSVSSPLPFLGAI